MAGQSVLLALELFRAFRIQLQRKKASMMHFGECIRFTLVNRRPKPTEGQREDPVAGTETGSRGSLRRNDGCQTTAPDNVPWLAERQDREGSCFRAANAKFFGHDFDR
jgi:hypothetical protein